MKKEYSKGAVVVKRAYYTLRLLGRPVRVYASHAEILEYVERLWHLRNPLGGRYARSN